MWFNMIYHVRLKKVSGHINSHQLYWLLPEIEDNGETQLIGLLRRSIKTPEPFHLVKTLVR